MTAFTIGLMAALLWVGVITTSAVLVRNSPYPPMKSIRKFRISRQALIEAKPSASQVAVPDNEIEFPLGPRLFRKRRTASHEPDESLIIRERIWDGEGERQGLAPETADVKIVSGKSEVPPPIAGPAGDFKTAGVPRPRADEPGAQTNGRNKTRSTGGVAPATRPGVPAGEARDPGAGEFRPVVVRPDAGPPPPAVLSGAGPDLGETGGIKRPKATKQPQRKQKQGANRVPGHLDRYALRDGPHSYVLVDDEGRLVKDSIPPDRA